MCCTERSLVPLLESWKSGEVNSVLRNVYVTGERPTSFARVLVQCMRRAGVTQKQLAEELDVSCTYVCRLMGGRTQVIPPRPELLLRIIKRLKPTTREEMDLIRLAYVERNPEARFFLPRLLPQNLVKKLLS